MKDYELIRYPMLTEKTTGLNSDYNTYTFCVCLNSTKIQIKEAIERLFNVQVEKVRTCNYVGKVKRTTRGIGTTRRYKKAYVTLKEGSKIDNLIEGL
ncbi:MAG: 50S ribosomal protein L23 [Bdellovibrionota bacterium]